VTAAPRARRRRARRAALAARSAFVTALAPAARHRAAQGAAAAAAAHLCALYSPQLEPRGVNARPPRMASTFISMSSHGAATRLALGAAVRRVLLVPRHRCT
jgi:hypothetical protein